VQPLLKLSERDFMLNLRLPHRDRQPGAWANMRIEQLSPPELGDGEHSGLV
jgi:hypothetical protein